MFLQTRFRLPAFIPCATLLLVTGFLVFTTEILLTTQVHPPLDATFAFLTVFILTWILLVFGELRKNAIKVKIVGEEVCTSNYYGLGFKSTYNFSYFDGYKTAIIPSDHSSYEYLYLMKNGKKIITLSQFYHGNYEDMKEALTGKVANLGQNRFNIFREIKDLFV